MLTLELLKERLSYDPQTGSFLARVKRKKLNVGDRAGCWSSKGYWRIKIDDREYAAHRLAWFYVHGRWPAKNLDHRNRNRADNRMDNLREATYAENSQNCKRAANNTSGTTGVCFAKQTGKWQASITVGGKPKYLGQYATVEEAASVYASAKQRLHTFHPTTNREAP